MLNEFNHQKGVAANREPSFGGAPARDWKPKRQEPRPIKKKKRGAKLKASKEADRLIAMFQAHVGSQNIPKAKTDMSREIN